MNYDAKINEKARQIQTAKSQIELFLARIEDLNSTSKKVRDLQSELHSSVQWTCGSLAGNTGVFGNVAAAIKSTFFNKTIDAISGSEYKRAQQGLESADAELRAKIDECNRKIEDTKREIQTCENEISRLKAEKAAEERRREQEAAARAAEALAGAPENEC